MKYSVNWNKTKQKPVTRHEFSPHTKIKIFPSNLRSLITPQKLIVCPCLLGSKNLKKKPQNFTISFSAKKCNMQLSYKSQPRFVTSFFNHLTLTVIWFRTLTLISTSSFLLRPLFSPLIKFLSAVGPFFSTL